MRLCTPVLAKPLILLGHVSIQVTLDSYASVLDELMLHNVRLILEKFVTKTERHEMKDCSATNELLQDAIWRGREN